MSVILFTSDHWRNIRASLYHACENRQEHQGRLSPRHILWTIGGYDTYSNTVKAALGDDFKVCEACKRHADELVTEFAAANVIAWNVRYNESEPIPSTVWEAIGEQPDEEPKLFSISQGMKPIKAATGRAYTPVELFRALCSTDHNSVEAEDADDESQRQRATKARERLDDLTNMLARQIVRALPEHENSKVWAS